jgi:hypothetical protein
MLQQPTMPTPRTAHPKTTCTTDTVAEADPTALQGTVFLTPLECRRATATAPCSNTPPRTPSVPSVPSVPSAATPSRLFPSPNLGRQERARGPRQN